MFHADGTWKSETLEGTWHFSFHWARDRWIDVKAKGPESAARKLGYALGETRRHIEKMKDLHGQLKTNSYATETATWTVYEGNISLKELIETSAVQLLIDFQREDDGPIRYQLYRMHRKTLLQTRVTGMRLAIQCFYRKWPEDEPSSE